MNRARIIALVNAHIVSAISCGIDFKEGAIAFKVLSFLMEEIDRNPDIDEEFLSDAAERLTDQMLAEAKT